MGLTGTGAGLWSERLDFFRSGIQLRCLLTDETPGTWGQCLVFTPISLKSSYAWVPKTLFSRLRGRTLFPLATLCVKCLQNEAAFCSGLLMTSLPPHGTKESDRIQAILSPALDVALSQRCLASWAMTSQLYKHLFLSGFPGSHGSALLFSAKEQLLPP